jgi:replicative DNA helicase
VIQYHEVTTNMMGKLAKVKVREVDAIPTPFPSWNKMCGEEGGRVGLAKGWFVVIGGTSGAGKSNLSYNIVAHAVRLGFRVGCVNFEMSTMQAVTRFASIVTGIPKMELDQGPGFNVESWQNAAALVGGLKGRLLINGPAVFTLKDVEESYRVLSGEGADMIVVDYGQLIQTGSSESLGQATAVSNTLRELTQKYNPVSVVLSQLNRENSKKKDTPPRKEALQGGSPWENNANQVVLLNHTVRERTPDFLQEKTELIGDKNRHGPSPFVLPVVWDHSCHRLTEYSPNSRDDRQWERVSSEEDVSREGKGEREENELPF